LDKKQAQITAAFADYASLQPVSIPAPVAAGHRFGYRARVKLAVQRIKGKPVIGLYRPESHRVLDASACPVHPPPVNALVHSLKQLIEKLRITPYDERHDRGQLRYLDIRYSFWQRRLLLTLVTRHMDFPQVRELTRELGRRFPQLVGVVQNINDTPGTEGNSIWGQRFHPLRGRDSLIEQIGHLRLHSPADAFTQVNPPVAHQLYQTVLEWAELSKEHIALDLYCGIGPIALYLATQAKLVIGIDDNTRAIRVAKENARRNGYHNTRFFAGDAVRKLRETASSLARIDCIVVNPPRTGLSPHAFSALGTVAAPRLAYVSCEPLSLARDLDGLCQAGYQVAKVQPFDMFPQTDKVETLVVLNRVGRADKGLRDNNKESKDITKTFEETDA
jgi:23S rRNA (uracil1939-C5)-methyltransferase